MPVRDTASAQPFLSPAERRQHAREVNQIVKLAADGKYPEALWPLAASVGFGPEDLKRLPVEVAAGVAEAQERLRAGPARVGRNLAALIDLCGIETLLREDPRDLMACLRTAASRASALFLARSMRCNEAAMGEQVSHASATVTAVEAQRAGNTGMRLMQASAQMEQVRQKLDIEAGKAERDGILPPEARRDEARRGRNIAERVERDRAREKHQKERDELELAMALEAAAQDAAARRAQESGAGIPARVLAGDGQESQSTPCKASNNVSAAEVVSEGGMAWSERRLDRDDAATCPAGSFVEEEMMMSAASRRSDQDSTKATDVPNGSLAPDLGATPCTVSSSLPEAEGRLPRGAGIPARESMLPAAGALDACTASATAEPLVPVVMLPLPLADRRAAASDALRELQSPAAKDDPANGWEVEMLGLAVRTGRASASIVARFVEETTAGDIFPEPGSTTGRRPSFPEFLGRLAPRGSPRVTATQSSSISIMT